jgi:hypothetical protein
MATIGVNPSYAFNINDIDLNWYIRNNIDSELIKNANVSFLGRTFSDILWTQAADGTSYLELDFGGFGFATDPSGQVTAGTVTGITESDVNGGFPIWYLLDTSISASGLYNAALTASNNDELSLVASALSGDDIIELSDLDDTMNGFTGNDIIYGRAGNDTLYGGGGDDKIYGGAGNDTLIGGPGTDTAYYSVTRSQASITHHSNGTVSVNALMDGSDLLSGIENLQFSDALYFTSQFRAPSGVLINNFAVGAGGWSSQDIYPRHVADINGDGYGDLAGFGQLGLLVSFGSGTGNFSAPALIISDFGQTMGWTSDNQFHRELADVNGDGRADVVGFGIAGTLVSLARAGGSVDNPNMGITDFGANQGWSTQDGFARTVGDINGDGKADIIGFGYAGTLVSLGNGDGTFQGARLGLDNFGVEQGWTSDNGFHRAVADVNGDGADDIIGFGYAGTLVALSNGDGTFDAAQFVLGNFGKNQGWSSQDSFARDVTDVNNDGYADIVGFGDRGTYVSYGQANGSFSSAVFDSSNFGANQGWTSDNIYHRELGDVNNDGFADIVGFGQAGVYAGFNSGDYFV